VSNPEKLCYYCLKNISGAKADACEDCLDALMRGTVGRKYLHSRVCNYCGERKKDVIQNKKTKDRICGLCAKARMEQMSKKPPKKQQDDSLKAAITNLIQGMPLKPEIERLLDDSYHR